MVKLLRIFSALVIFLISQQSFSQNSEGTSFFKNNYYPDYPVVLLRENFFGNPVYFIEGEKVSAREVRAYMEIMPGDANDFSQTHTKALTGTGILLTGQAVVLGALGYAYDNRNRLNNQIVLNWFVATTAGGVGGAIGRSMNRQGVRKINGLIDNHNFLIRQDELRKPYLKMDFRNNFLGEKIDIYDGPNLLSKDRINLYKETYPEFAEFYRNSQRNQNWSLAIGILDLASTLVFVGYIISPQIQSSAPSNLLLPLTIASFGTSISGGIFRRAARNQTRMALMKFNFGEEFKGY
ncbi:hypothetical protein [Arthrospiribacter ruber]|uniref:Uncharacterized protein n=1 Tax=Arthrospiribacter ruber TaxID=2487934 RepID=A0A951MKE4_9BACT|nr:hypothetical protein [Arthrospiribacter ruber]MBW3470406.1 hypothetical protein [Arthrospiribacter ruber]